MDRYLDGQFSPKILFSIIIKHDKLYIRAPLLTNPNIGILGGLMSINLSNIRKMSLYSRLLR